MLPATPPYKYTSTTYQDLSNLTLSDVNSDFPKANIAVNCTELMLDILGLDILSLHIIMSSSESETYFLPNAGMQS